MKTKKTLQKFFLSTCFILISFIGFSETIIMSDGGYQTYYTCNIPTGTFYLRISPYYAAATYEWSGGSIPQGTTGQYANNITYPTVTTTYCCKKTISAKSVQFFYFTITVTKGTVQTVTGGNCFNQGGTINLATSQSNFYYYLFYNNSSTPVSGSMRLGTGTSPGINPAWNSTGNGTYTVKIGHGGGPYNSPVCYQAMSGSAVFNGSCLKTTDINDNTEYSALEIKVFPNPSNGNFTIATSNIGEYVLVNELGQEVRNFSITSENNSIEIQNLKAGMYFLKNIDGNTDCSSKIIVIE